VAFDKTQPTDTTKIRNLGVVIRPNWVAIEQGDDTFRPLAENLQNRTPSALPPDPTLLADTSKLYCKEDGSGVAELFNMDASRPHHSADRRRQNGRPNHGNLYECVSVSMAELRQIHKRYGNPLDGQFLTVAGSSITAQTGIAVIEPSGHEHRTGRYKATGFVSSSRQQMQHYAVIGMAISTSSGGRQGQDVLIILPRKQEIATGFSS
jgi:hypothetical protein